MSKLPLQSSNNSNILGKTIEETYQKKSQLEHILLRPDTYIGSVDKHKQSLWIYEDDEMVQREIEYVPGLYKIFDEILVNAADNKQRDPSMDTVKVDIDIEKNCISVYNTGNGVPIEIHKEEKIYVPEMIFGHLLTSSNYDDAEKKTTGGRNGYGAKLTNIFSTEFTIETADGKRLKKYKQVFSNNMGNKSEPIITKCKENENWTKVTFRPDLAKFKMTELEDDVVALMKKRVMDIAGCLGKTVKVFLNGIRVPVKDFRDYCNLYLKSVDSIMDKGTERCIMEKANERWEVCFSVSAEQFQQVSFVNSIATIKGGTHVDHVTSQITNYVINHVNNKPSKTKGKNKKDFPKVTTHAVKTHVWIFVNALIDNPAFDSQTKETLTTRQNSFGSKCELSDEFLTKVCKSKIVSMVESWAEHKAKKEMSKTDGKKGGRIYGLSKLDDANHAGGKNSDECTLILTEGDSAKTLAMSGLSVVGRDTYGVFPLRGKLLNVREASHKQIMDNVEIQCIKKILGLQQGKQYEDTKSLRYGHLMIMTDQDHDGSHIKGLLINFIHSFWPTLLKVPSFLIEFITPIVKASKNEGLTLSFYTIPEYESWKESLGENARGWSIKYYKGLGTSTDDEAMEYFRNIENNRKVFEPMDEQDGEAIEMAFSKKKIEARKNWLRQFEPGTYLDSKGKLIKYTDFVNKELILFSIADLQRSIPSMVDGLKPGQRKILFSAFKMNFVHEAKVAEFSGVVSANSAYHHGEQSLHSTIIGMAQDFVGSNNINLFKPAGQFGSRLKGGKDAASARYVRTHLCPITRLLFPKGDDGILDYLNDDGQSIEPFWYIPIIPMVLVNGSEGIGTGWSSYIPNYNPRDIVANIRRLLNGEEMRSMKPWYKGFGGSIEKTATKDNTYTVSGIIEERDEENLRITELPIRRWTDEYKEFLESIDSGNDNNKDAFIKSFSNHSDNKTVLFDVVMTKEKLDEAKQEGLLKKFKLTTSLTTSNMHLFDAKGVIKKFDSPEQILEEFFHLRLEYYEKRKKFLVANLERELLKLENKVRFILAVVKGEIIVSNKKRKDLYQELRQKGYTPFPKKPKDVRDADENEESTEVAESKGVQVSDYDYLLSMAIGSLTTEKVAELLAAKSKMGEDVENMKNTAPKTLWLRDLDALDKGLDEQDVIDAKAEKERLDKINERMKESNQNQKPPKHNAKKSNKAPAAAAAAAKSNNSASVAGNVAPPGKPKGRGGPKKALGKKKKVDSDDDDDDVLDLNERLAAYHLDSSPSQSPAMDSEETVPEESMPDKDESNEVIAAPPKDGKSKGGRKPAAGKMVKPAAATRKRGPAGKSQKLITDVLKPAQSSEVSPDKKVRKIRASPFNKKSSSVLGRIGGVGVEEQSGGSSSASGSPDVDCEIVTAKARPQRANRRIATYVLSDSEPDTDDSEFEVDDNDD